MASRRALTHDDAMEPEITERAPQARARAASATLLAQAPGLARELWRVRRSWRRGRPTLPWKLELITTYSCGSRCKTCLIWTRYRRDPAARARELGVDAFAQAAASIGHHLRWISFTGGEVTDRDDAAALAIAVGRAAPRAAVLSFTSHGLAPEATEALIDEVARAFPRRAIMITLSLDGLGEDYERIRGVDGVARVFEAMDRLQALSARAPNVQASFQTTLSRLNLDVADAVVAEAERRAPGSVVTVANDSRVLTEGKLEGVDVRGDERLAAGLRAAEGRVRGLGPSAVFARLYLRALRRALPADDAPLACAAGFAALTITPYGEVLQCDRHDEPLGTLEAPDYDLAALVESPAFAAALAPLAGCRECFTPCQAYPSMMQAPLAATKAALL